MSWGVAPATAVTVFVLDSVHAAPLGVPTPSPIVIVGGGPAAVSVTSTSPNEATVKVCESDPCTATVPLNWSVADEGDVTGVLLPHAAAVNAKPRASASRREATTDELDRKKDIVRFILGPPALAGDPHFRQVPKKRV